MAAFDILPPEIQPASYLKDFKPITQPESDKSTGIALTTAGQALSSGVKVADTAIKEDISDTVRKGAEAERDDYTAGLTNARAAQTGQSPLNILVGAQGTDKTPIPSAIDSGLTGLGKLQGAMDSSKISETTYYGRQAMILKGLRATYPGYVDYIDERASAILGVNPANAYVKSIINDINTSATKTLDFGKQVEKDVTESVASGNSVLMPSLQAYRAGTISAEELLSKLSSNKAVAYQRADTVAKLAADEAQDKVDVKENQSALAVHVGRKVGELWNNLRTGWGDDADSFEIFLNTHAKNGDIDPQQANDWAMRLTQLRNKVYTESYQEAVQDGTLRRLNGNTTAVKDTINNSLATMDDAIKELSGGRDISKVAASMNFNKDIVDHAMTGLFNSPDQEARQWTLNSSIISKLGGPDSQAKFFKDSIVNDVPNKLKGWTASRVMGMSAQPDADTTGKVTTLNDVLQEAKDKDKSFGTANPKVIQAITNTVDRISDPKVSDGEKFNLIKAYFDPADRGVMNKFIEESGERPKVFTRLTSEETTKEVRRLSEKFGPEVWNNYKAWAEGEFGSSIFRNELSTMRDLSRTVDSDTYHVHFDDKNNRFELRGKSDEPLNWAQMKVLQLGGLAASVNRLNTGLSTLSTIHQAEGGTNTAAYLLDTMKGFGYSPKEPSAKPGEPGWREKSAEDRKNLGDILDKVWTSVAGSNDDIQRIKQQKAEHDQKVKEKAALDSGAN